MSLISLAFYTLLERKVLGLVGGRVGPFKVSFLGVLQPMSDALKIFSKEKNYLLMMSPLFYNFNILILIFGSLCVWYLGPYQPGIRSIKTSIILILLILRLNTINTIFSGWSTGGKFPMLASLRIVSQIISYEGLLYIILFFLLVMYGNLLVSNLSGYSNLIFLSPVIFIFWLVSLLAELRRTPTDFSERERELVRGFNLDYGSTLFSFIFMAEYSIILFFRVLSCYIFFEVSIFPLFSFFLIWIRAVLPRYRYDSFIYLCWKVGLPLLTSYLLIFILLVW